MLGNKLSTALPNVLTRSITLSFYSNYDISTCSQDTFLSQKMDPQGSGAGGHVRRLRTLKRRKEEKREAKNKVGMLSCSISNPDDYNSLYSTWYI